MTSFVFFNIPELQNALTTLVELIKPIDEIKDDDNIDESFKILNLAIECISGYQDFIKQLAHDNIVKMDFDINAYI